MAKGVTFTKDSAKRIAEVVRTVEGEPTNLRGRSIGRASNSDKCFWAVIDDNATPLGGSGAVGQKYEWTEQVRSGDSFIEHPDPRSGTVAADTYAVFIVEASGVVVAPLAVGTYVLIRMDFEDGNPKYTIIGSVSGIDLYNDTTKTVSQSPFIQIPTTNGTDNALQFATSTVSGRDGGKLQLKPGSYNYQTLVWNGSAWTIDYPRGHS